MQWAPLANLKHGLHLPDGYIVEQLGRQDINDVTNSVRSWYQDISIGSARKYLDNGFYLTHTSLAGEEERDQIAYVGKFGGRIVSMTLLRRDVEASVIYGAFGAVDPAHRGLGIAAFATYIMDEQARSMGAAMAYAHVTLKSSAVQRMFERAGFKPVGIVPASDWELHPQGHMERVTEVLYTKVYAAPEKLASVITDHMTPAVKELWEFLNR